jgi:hypothetical protein
VGVANKHEWTLKPAKIFQTTEISLKGQFVPDPIAYIEFREDPHFYKYFLILEMSENAYQILQQE